MIRLNLTALLYSNRNIDLAYKAKKICREVSINLINALDFVDLTLKIMELKPQIVFFDLSTIQLEKQIMELFISKGEYYIPNIVLIYETKEQLKEHEEFNFSTITLDELETLLQKEEKNFKLNAVLSQKEKNHRTSFSSKVNTHLFSMGFSPKHRGYSYLLEAIKIVMSKNGVIGSLNTEVYPLICAKFKTTVSNVERNIRNAISCAFDCYERLQKKQNGFNVFDYFNSRPTNREFICLYTEQMLDYFLKEQEKNVNI
jgi:two-component system response regulator (stage 0 sporulation protein A)